MALLTVTALNTPDARRFLTLQGWFWFHSANVLREFHGAHSPSLEFGWFELTHFWSLAVEQHFYLVWPFLVYLLSVRGLRAAAIAIIGCSVALRTGLIGIDSPLAAALLATPKYLAGLAVGGLAATYTDSVPKHQLAKLAKIGGLGSLLVLACAYAGTSAPNQDDAFRGWVAPLAALATACTALLVSARPGGRLARGLSNPLLVTYGKYSYGIYVFHVLPGPLTRQIELASFPGGYSVGALVYVALFMTVPLAVSMVSYRYLGTAMAAPSSCLLPLREPSRPDSSLGSGGPAADSAMSVGLAGPRTASH